MVLCVVVLRCVIGDFSDLFELLLKGTSADEYTVLALDTFLISYLRSSDNINEIPRITRSSSGCPASISRLNLTSCVFICILFAFFSQILLQLILIWAQCSDFCHLSHVFCRLRVLGALPWIPAIVLIVLSVTTPIGPIAGYRAIPMLVSDVRGHVHHGNLVERIL